MGSLLSVDEVGTSWGLGYLSEVSLPALALTSSA